MYWTSTAYVSSRLFGLPKDGSINQTLHNTSNTIQTQIFFLIHTSLQVSAASTPWSSYLTVVVTATPIWAAVCDPTIPPIIPAPRVAVVIQFPAMSILITFGWIEFHTLKLRGDFDGMIGIGDNFSSLGKIAVLVNLPVDGYLLLHEVLKSGTRAGIRFSRCCAAS